MVITDHFTRYALAYPSKTQTAQTTARILWDNFICHFGFPEKFISDQGRNFESDLIKELCKIAGVQKLHTTPYHPQGNGQCEGFNSTLCNMLGTLSEEEFVKIVAHKGRHKLQDKWESEEYVVVEQPIAGTPVYRVQPVTGGNIRTLHRNLLLPLGVKLEPDYDSDDSILEEDDSSSDESVIPGDTGNEVCDRERLVQKSQPHSEESKHVEFDSKVDIFPSPEVQSNPIDSIVEPETRKSYPRFGKHW